MTPSELSKIIEGCRRHERYAQNLLYKHFYGYAYSICARYSTNEEETREILNDGFMKVFTKMDKYTTGLSFEGWIKRVMVNTAIDRYRVQIRETPTTDIDNAYGVEVSPDAVINLSFDELVKLFQKLPYGYRTSFTLFAIEGYEYSEIADTLKVSLGTVKSNIFNARKLLKQMIENNEKVNAYER